MDRGCQKKIKVEELKVEELKVEEDRIQRQKITRTMKMEEEYQRDLQALEKLKRKAGDYYRNVRGFVDEKRK